MALAAVPAACRGAAPADTAPPPTTRVATTSTTSTPPPTTTAPPPADAYRPDPHPVSVLADAPVVEPRDGDLYVNPGWAVRHEGTWHMFPNSFSAWPGASTVAHLTSPDGVGWEPEPADPVFASGAVPFAAGNAFFTTGYVAADGTWVAYYYTFEGAATAGFIGRATAPDPTGPWTSDPEPVLTPGEPGVWDGLRVIEPSVIPEGSGFAMFYVGVNEAGEARVGRASSADGVAWEKAGEPVFEPVQGWEGGGVTNPQVVRAGDRYVMVYRAGRLGLYRAGLAVSDDGVRWAPLPSNPLLTTEISPQRQKFYQFELVVADGGLRLYLEAGPAPAFTDVYLLEFPVPVPGPALGARVTYEGSAAVIEVEPVGFEVASGAVQLRAYLDRAPPRPGELVPAGSPRVVEGAATRLTISDLEPGEHLVWLGAVDGAGRALEAPAPLGVRLEVP